MKAFIKYILITKQLLLLLLVVLFLSFTVLLPAKVITVDKNSRVKTIKRALSLAVNGDQININKGYYSETEIVINKSVKINGINSPVIDAEGKSSLILVKADSVIISGLVLMNTAVSFLSDNAAIKLDEVKNCIVENNKLIDNFFGIYLAKSANCIIRNNNIKAHSTTESTSGNGIHLWYCKNISVEGNKIEGQRDGIYFEFVRDGLIFKNYSKDNLRYGLHFMFSDSCHYWSNTFENNGAGVAVMYTKFVEMSNNNFINNWGAASYGILLKEISDSRIYKNNFVRNTSGLYMEGCNRIIVEHNNFTNNGWAVKLLANSADNKFISNNFWANSFNISTNSRQNFNFFEGNYWSDYKGYDLNKDGIGDVPFRPVRLFSIIVEQQPAALILLHSLFIDMLDVAESVIPSITPDALRDNKPMIRMIN